MKTIPFLIVLVTLVTCLFCTATAQDSTTPAPTPTILVLDCSGSMWGKVQGESKIAIAKKAIRDMIKTWPSDQPLGLLAYGHRKADDCADIELVIPPGPLNQAAFSQALEKLTPRGMTPLSDAVTAAAEALNYTQQAGSVILLSDGLETCKKDPCAVAETLAKKGIAFRAHVIGFDLSSKELISIECLAKNTGGAFLSAMDAAGLQSALQTAVKATTDQAPPTVARTKNLTLTTRAAAGSAPLEAYYRIFKTGDGLGQKETVAAGSGPAFALAPGKYSVESQWGRATMTLDTEIVAEKNHELEFILGAGSLQLTALTHEGGEPVEAFYRLFYTDTDAQGKRAQISANGRGEFKYTAGKYLVTAEWGNATVEQEVEIKANERSEATVILNVGTLSVTGIPTPNSEPIKAFFKVSTNESSLGGGRKQIAASGTGQFKLPVGKYIVTAEWGKATAEQEVEVQPGQNTVATINLNAGVGVVKALASPEGEPVKAFFRVSSTKPKLDGSRQEVAASGNGEFILPAGTYTVRAAWDSASVSQDITVTAGERSEYTLILNAGILIIKPVEGAKLPMFRIFQQALDLQGKRKEVVFSRKPEHPLQAGKYLIVPDGKTQEEGTEVEIRAGERTEAVLK